MTDDLKPCPFCGGAAERIDFGPGDAENAGGSCIACTRCQASGNVEFGHKENFIDRWNTRAAESALAQRAEGGEAVPAATGVRSVPSAKSKANPLGPRAARRWHPWPQRRDRHHAGVRLPQIPQEHQVKRILNLFGRVERQRIRTEQALKAAALAQGEVAAEQYLTAHYAAAFSAVDPTEDWWGYARLRQAYEDHKTELTIAKQRAADCHARARSEQLKLEEML